MKIYIETEIADKSEEIQAEKHRADRAEKELEEAYEEIKKLKEFQLEVSRILGTTRNPTLEEIRELKHRADVAEEALRNGAVGKDLYCSSDYARNRLYLHLIREAEERLKERMNEVIIGQMELLKQRTSCNVKVQDEAIEKCIEIVKAFDTDFELTLSFCHRLFNAGYRKIDGNTSDGYHTFNELYHHRAILFAMVCNQNSDKAWKSKKHSDGTMFNNMFIVGIETPQGQATYHYDIEPYWDYFKVKELETAPIWDGHTPSQAIDRILEMSKEAAGYRKQSDTAKEKKE